MPSTMGRGRFKMRTLVLLTELEMLTIESVSATTRVGVWIKGWRGGGEVLRAGVFLLAGCC